MKIACIQFSPRFMDREDTLRRLPSLIVEAARNGANLIVCPEMIYGYSFMSEDEARPFSEVLTDPDKPGQLSSMSVMRALAAKLDVAIAWGLVEEDSGTGNLHNSQCLITPEGRYWVARKANSWGNDWLWATEGDASPPIAEFGGKKIGLLICADVRNKSDKIDDFYEPGDAQIVAFSANWGRGGFPSGRWVKFARANKCWLAVSNRYGREAHNDFGEGGVCVIEPCGKVHCHGLRWNEPCIVYADVP